MKKKKETTSLSKVSIILSILLFIFIIMASSSFYIDGNLNDDNLKNIEKLLLYNLIFLIFGISAKVKKW